MTKESTEAPAQSEEQLISTAQTAVSQCNWVVGECAAQWTRRYAKGRTDADFGALIGLSGDQVYQRRRVWEVFGDVVGDYPSLKWSHFYVALTWDDAPECLQWAEEIQATVAEMKAWRRAMRGDDLTQDPEDERAGELVSFLPTETTAVRDPAMFEGGGRPSSGGRVSEDGEENEYATVAGHARQLDDSGAPYAPYRQGAGSPAPKEDSSDTLVAERPRPSTEQTIQRLTNSLQRFNKSFTPEMAQEFKNLPEKLRTQFLQAVGELSSKAANLM
jgi:hypothetical protein